ncbi:MAG: NFACT RNA binding domain-containing protein [Anaerolineae bacterium]
MYFDALTTTAIATELQAELLGGRVQQVLLPDRLSLALEIYAHRQRRYLLASAHPQAARIHLLSAKPRRGVEGVSPLLLLLRKYVRHSRLVEVHQPPAERILHLTFDGPQGPVTLVIEAIGHQSNLVLVAGDGAVLDALKRVGPDINRFRVVLPGHAYVPPPAQDKLLPTEVTEYRLRQVLAQWPPEALLRQALVEGVAGISPLAAREIAYRASGDTDVKVERVERISPVLEAILALTCEPPQPSLARDEEDGIVAFAPYALTHLGTYEPAQSMSVAIEAYFGAESGGYQAAKAPLFQAIEAAQRRLARRREKLAEEQVSAGDPEALKQMGEAILAYAHQIEPGQAWLLADWTPGQPALRVRLDPRLSPPENAEAYFRRYRKAQRAAKEIPAQMAQVEMEEEYLDQLAQDLQMAEDRPEIDAVRNALAQAGYLKEKRTPASSPVARPLRLTSPDGFVTWVGKNALQNEKLTFQLANPDDLWLHARGIPGAHVIVQTGGRPVPEQTLEWAARLAAYYSRGREDTQVDVDVVPRQHVRRLREGRPGQVSYRHERTIRVAPQTPSVLKEESRENHR